MSKRRESADRLRPRRLAAALARRARGLGVRARLLPYRPPEAPSAHEWTTRYEAGDFDYFADAEQSSRYGVLVGYMQLLGDDLSVLDVGCGPGLLRACMDRMPFRRYLGVDPAPASIEAAGGLTDERTAFVVGDAFASDLGTFDVAVCNEMLYCVPEPAPLLDRMRELLRPSGHLLTSNLRHPGDAGLHRMIDSRFELVDRVEVRGLTSGRARWIACHRRR